MSASTLTYTAVGAFPTGTTYAWTSIGYDQSTGTFYAVNNGSGAGLYSFTDTSDLAHVGIIGYNTISGAMSSTGVQYFYDYAGDNIYTLNLSTAASTLLVRSPQGASSGYTSSMACIGDTLYYYITGGGVTTYLCAVNLTTNAASVIGTNSALASTVLFADGSTLYTISGNNVLIVDTSDASLASYKTITGVDVPASFTAAGVGVLAGSSVPEPAESVAFCGVGALFAAMLIRKRARKS